VSKGRQFETVENNGKCWAVLDDVGGCLGGYITTRGRGVIRFSRGRQIFGATLGGLGRACVPCGAENLLVNFQSIQFCGCGYVVGWSAVVTAKFGRFSC